MTDTSVVHLMSLVLLTSAKLCAPIVITTMAVGLVISILQSATSIQEATLSFVPKLAVSALVLVIAGRWMLGELSTFTTEVFAEVPALLSSG
jgi:flagellar biosynthetic protein FliQ